MTNIWWLRIVLAVAACSWLWGFAAGYTTTPHIPPAEPFRTRVIHAPPLEASDQELMARYAQGRVDAFPIAQAIGFENGYELGLKWVRELVAEQLEAGD